MIMYDPDPEVIRWGLDFLNINPFPTPGYCDSNNQSLNAYSYSPNAYPGIYTIFAKDEGRTLISRGCNTSQFGPYIYPIYFGNDYMRDGSDDNYAREESTGVDHSTVENDEVIAHALQEELSQLAEVEASGSSHAEEERSQASVLSQDWINPIGTFNSVSEGFAEEGDGMEPSSSCSSSEERHDERGYMLELADDYSTLDGEVGKRLNQMVSIPHVPRINGEIPSVDEAISDHQRLIDRLRLYELVELKVQGDGNCQFRALSDQFYRTPDHHKFVRQQVITQLKANCEIYEGYVPMGYAEYLEKMSKDGEWGDHVTLQAAADSYGVKILVITSFKDTCYIEILPSVQKSKRVIFLSFWAEVHYNSIYSGEDLPMLEAKKKKRWTFWK